MYQSNQWDGLSSDDVGFIHTKNSHGYMVRQPDELMHAFVSFARGHDQPCVDVGAAYGVASLYAIEQGVKDVIAIDPEQAHLDYIEQQFNSMAKASDQTIEYHCGYFPKTITVDKHPVSAMLMARVLHFMRGSDITQLLNQAFHLLMPGGKLFISTSSPYVNLLLDYIDTYEQQERLGLVEWPGEIEDLTQYLPASDQQQNQIFGHVLTPKVLSAHLEKAGFKIVRAEYSTRPYQAIAQMTDERYAGKEDTVIVAVK